MRHVISFMTWRCGLGCPYCGYGLQQDGLSVKYRPAATVSRVERELTPDEWIIKLKTLAPASYDFCGGEPTQYKDLEQILAALPAWAITSNTTLPTEQIEKFPLDRCVSWTASCHYNAPEPVRKRWHDNIAYLKTRGVNVSVTLVAMPSNIDFVINECRKLQGEGYHAQVHPYYDEPAFTWDDFPEEWETLTRSKFVCYDERLKSWTGIAGQNKTCKGGSDYICISPDGKIYRCLWQMLSGEPALNAPDTHLHACSLNCYLPCDFVYGLGRRA